MRGSVIELNQSKKYAGRTFIKWVLLEIHQSPDKWNKNGINWKESYIQSNLESAKGMPIAAEFLDSWEKDEPYGHGLSEVKDNEPLFENSVAVGYTEKAYIDTIELNGEQKRVLIAEGYLYHQRYPKFVKWLKSEMYDNKNPDTSVEISAKEGNEYIVYEDGWKEEGRIPKEFDFSGSAILGISPADDSAILLELNQKKGEKKMKDNNEVVLELNNKLETKNTEINELTNSLNTTKAELENTKTELNEKTEEVNSLVAEKKDNEKELNSLKEQVSTMESELNELREFKKDVENKELESELNSKLENYTEEEKKVVETEINEFKKAPSKEKMDAIISEINSTIAKKVVEQRRQSSEQNSAQAEDIFGDVYEINSEESTIDDLL